jgi:pimeloyl-ACP methyl ester carboxylesterase
MPATGRWTAPDLSGVAARTLLVAGAASPLATHRLVSRLADQLPDARVATVEGADHLLPLTHPSALADLVTSGRIAVAG